MIKGENPVIVAHNNTIRGIMKMIRNLSNEEVMQVEVPNSIPIVFELDANMH